ncbi:hypothetical protein DDB_G0281423 [Dictyostelium discoideum AX4]|uniref:Uncharacterized protein n=1 Tax=Dictyostelium discoideum TaxID=44689 RepID=Q54TZ6_DICDI|nr:hypothetical protein DDB_G0281423 [Dictyostelium discoideum AX4]EAL66693.1 hypothetical protein DDB_G0281423 [Dictyostelium discoideum AX4]|eukprot:XP_640665.1 hypothetical protein DDB_G0281423 [Dictyostelium discoideum AX4]
MDHIINNNENENLFWKVYRNVYLNKKIFEQLEIVLDIKFKDYRMYNSKSRIKFKDINSLKWMIDNCEFEILKKKIENEEFIQICVFGMKSLAKIKDENLSIQLLKMLMNNQRDNLEPYIIGVAIEYEKLKMIKVLVNEPYSMEITRFNIDQAVQTCSAQFLDELLLMCDFELRETCKNFKLSLIHQSINNSKNNENNDILNIIIKYPEMILPIQNRLYTQYSTPYIRYNLPSLTSAKQLFSIFETNLFKNEFKVTKDLITVIIRDQFKYPFNISKLLVLFGLYIQNLYFDESQQLIDKKQEIKSKMFEIFDNNETSINEKEKQLFKLFILEINSKEIYKIYFYKYSELIDEMDNNSSYKTLSFLNVFQKFDEIIKLNDKNELTNFILKIIDSEIPIKGQKFKNLFKKIIDTIINYLMDDEYNYKIIINEIKRKNLEKLFSIPFEWNPILREIMIEPIDGGLNKLFINDKETIDWLSSTFKLKSKNHKNVKTIYNNKMKKGLVQFSTHQLYTYSILMLNKYSYGKSLMRSLIYPSIYSHPLITVNGNKEYLNKSEIMELLFKSIISYNLNETLLYVSLIDLKNDFKQFISIWNRKSKLNEYRFLFLDQLFSKTDIGTIKNIKVEIVIDSIKYWINEAKSNLQNNDLELLFETIINYLYKKLIQNQNVKINQVIEIRELVLILNIKLEHTQFHVFYYLNIKSPKLIKYLLLNESLLSSLLINLVSPSFKFPDGFKYYCSNSAINYNQIHPTDSIPIILDPIKISFDFIVNESFMNLLEYIDKFWSNNNTLKVNKQLYYYLDINRFDLFLKEFEENKEANVFKKAGNIAMLNKEFIRSLSVGKINDSKLINFKKYIDLSQLFKYQENEKFTQDIINHSIVANEKELVSFIINYLKIEKINIYCETFNLCYYDIFKYIFENHSNTIKSIDVGFVQNKCISGTDTFIQDSISLFELFLKYYPNSFDNISFIGITSNSKLHHYFVSIKLMPEYSHTNK